VRTEDAVVCVQMQSRMDRYFNQLASLVDEKKTSSRIRFLLLDTIDLRKVSVSCHVVHKNVSTLKLCRSYYIRLKHRRTYIVIVPYQCQKV